ncbi:MAG: methyltransferase domain-containing protein [Bryobacterales bacterium]
MAALTPSFRGLQPVADPETSAYILGFSSQSPEARSYAETHLARFLKTIEITPTAQEDDRLLEMGAYLQITPALKRLGYGEVRGCYLGQLGETHAKTVTSTTGEVFSCEVDLFDAEKDIYPYPDAHFATVVCCELLEHLAEDPMHLMSEVNLILRPGGTLVLSTPNICALRAVAAVLLGGHPGLYTQYTARKGGNAIEPRHAREYTPSEMEQLFEAAGFQTHDLQTGPYGLQQTTAHDWALEAIEHVGCGADLRDDVIHIVGIKSGVLKERYPTWLYA